MSFKDILSAPDKYWANLHVNSISSNTPVVAPTEAFRSSLFGGADLGVTGGFNYAGTFLVGYGTGGASDLDIDSASFNRTTGIFTVPKTGKWFLEAGIFYTTFSGIGATGTSILVGIGPVGDTSNPLTTSQTYVNNALSNWSIQTSGLFNLTAGDQYQAYTQQGAAAVTLSGANKFYDFFAGYLVEAAS